MQTTIFGIIIGVGIMFFAIVSVINQDPGRLITPASMYLNLPSFLIVLGGTLSSTLIAHPFSHLIRGFIAFIVVFTRREFDFIKLIEDICQFSQLYTTKGIPGIEEKINSYKTETLLKDGLRMVVNGYSEQEIKEYLEVSLQRKYDRDMIDYYLFRTMGRASPAFGMVGTLVGLIFMLSIMGDSPEKIGPFLAVALVTTFYGLILAHLIFLPMGNKLQHQAEINIRIGRMAVEGVNYILKKQHPVYIKDQLAGYLSPAMRTKLLKEKQGAEAAAPARKK